MSLICQTGSELHNQLQTLKFRHEFQWKGVSGIQVLPQVFSLGIAPLTLKTLVHYIYIKPSFRLAGQEKIADIIIRDASAPAEPVTDRHRFHIGFTTILNSCFPFCFPF